MRTSITIFRDLILWLCPQIQLSFLVVSVPDLNQPQGVGLGLRPRFRSEIKTTVGLGLGLRITSEMQVFRNKGNLEHLLICLSSLLLTRVVTRHSKQLNTPRNYQTAFCPGGDECFKLSSGSPFYQWRTIQ